MSVSACPSCGKPNSDFNVRCVACGAELPDPLAATIEVSSGPDAASEGIARGATFGRFIVVDRLGEGAAGLVISAYDPALDRKVAIKILRPGAFGPGGAERGRTRLVREAQAMAKLAHPGVVTVHEVGAEGGQVFVVMECVEGQTLRGWLAEKPRSHREVLERFREAGRGLSAAHEAGLVHRDFKPDNVLVGRDGNAKVTDFGLVSVLEASEEPAAERAHPGELTSAGALLGTPAYMAPEQHERKPVDARADQFAFAVSLYEGLYGVRPFDGKTYAALRAKVLAGELCEPPRGARVPSWLREVVLRGLRVRPEDRWPSMDAMLVALARDPAASRRRAAWTLALLVLAGVAVFGLARRPAARVEPCKGAAERLAGVWDDERRQAVRAAMLATGRPYAEEAWRRVEASLDQRARAWASMYTDSCEATRVRGEQSTALLDLRTACLERRRRELGAFAGVLARGPDTNALDRAPSAALSLPALDACADGAALAGAVPLPREATARAKIEGLRARLDEAEALDDAGKYKDGLGLATAIAGEARGAGYAPVEAEALALLARLQRDTGDAKAAEATAREAIPVAARARDDELVAKLWAVLVYVVGVVEARHDDALAMRTAADGALARVGEDTPVAGAVWNALGLTLQKKGDYEESRRYLERALAVYEKANGPEHPTVASVLNSLANVAGDLEKPDDAIRYHTRALAIREKVLGPTHPHVAITLNNLGVVYNDLSQYERALPYFERALRIWEAALGPEHVNVAAALTNIGNVMNALGRFAEGRKLHARSLAIEEKARGPDHPSVGTSLNNLALTAEGLGDVAEARAYYERALAVREKALGPAHKDVGKTLSDLGGLLCNTGKPEEGRARLERSIAVYEKASGPDAAVLVEPLARLGECRRRGGDPRAAVPLVERAVAIGASKKGAADPADLAGARFALARALWDAGKDRERAAALAREARAAYAGLGRVGEKAGAEIEAWLREKAPGR